MGVCSCSYASAGAARRAGWRSDNADRGANLFHVRGGKVTRLVSTGDRERPSKPWGCRSRRCRRRTWRSCGGLLEAFERRDHERAFEFYDPDIVWEHAATTTTWAASITGIEGVRTYWREWLSAWSDLRFEVQEVLEAGDEVVALIHNQRQWGRHSGIEVAWPPYGLIFTIRDDKVVRSALLSRAAHGPRSRGAVGVGDVAGERGGCAPGAPGVGRRGPGCDGSRSGTPTSLAGGRRARSMTSARYTGGSPSVAMQDWIETFEEVSVVAEELRDVGDDRVVLAMRRLSGRAKLSGADGRRCVTPSSAPSRTGRSCEGGSTWHRRGPRSRGAFGVGKSWE